MKKVLHYFFTDIIGSRRLITYRRIPNSEVDAEALALAAAAAVSTPKLKGQTANDLNPFRKSYFSKFESPASSSGASTPAKLEPTAEAETPEAPPKQRSEPTNTAPASNSIPRPDSRPDPPESSAPAHTPD